MTKSKQMPLPTDVYSRTTQVCFWKMFMKVGKVGSDVLTSTVDGITGEDNRSG